MRRIKNNRFLRFGLLLLSTALALLAAEIVLRLFCPAPYYGYAYIPPQQQFFQYDPILGWRGRPSASGIFASTDFRVSVTHDRHGYRNTSPPFVEDKDNILILGDSYGWGWGVEDDEVFSARLSNGNDRINAYNLSAPGYGTDQEYLLLKRFLKSNARSDYRATILLFYMNDFLDVLETVRHSYPKSRFVFHNDELVLDNVPVPELKREEYDRPSRNHAQLERGVLRSFHVLNLIRRKGPMLMQTLINAWSRKGDLQLRKFSPLPPEFRQLTFRLLKEIDALCRENNMALHVVLMMTSNTNEVGRQELKELAAMLSTEDIRTSYFHSRTFPSTDLWLDKHLTGYGHKLLASHILALLRAPGGMSVPSGG